MAETIVNLNTQIEARGKYCGRCRFYDSGLSRCILFRKELRDYIVKSFEWALPVICDAYRCEECIRAQVENGKDKG